MGLKASSPIWGKSHGESLGLYTFITPAFMMCLTQSVSWPLIPKVEVGICECWAVAFPSVLLTRRTSDSSASVRRYRWKSGNGVFKRKFDLFISNQISVTFIKEQYKQQGILSFWRELYIHFFFLLIKKNLLQFFSDQECQHTRILLDQFYWNCLHHRSRNRILPGTISLTCARERSVVMFWPPFEFSTR